MTTRGVCSVAVAGTIKADADIILVIHHLKNNPQSTVDCRDMYQHQDGKNKKKQEKHDMEREEEKDYFDYLTDSDNSVSEIEEGLINMFQLRAHK